MEAVGATASFISIITLAVQSAEVVYKTVKTIEDGRPAIQNLATAVHALQQLLRQIKQLESEARDVLARDGDLIFNETRQLLMTCTADLNGIQSKLQAVQKAPNESLRAKARRTAKMLVMGQDVENWWNTIHTYLGLFGVYIGQISMYVDPYTDLPHLLELIEWSVAAYRGTNLINSENLDLIHGAITANPNLHHRFDSMESLIRTQNIESSMNRRSLEYEVRAFLLQASASDRRNTSLNEDIKHQIEDTGHQLTSLSYASIKNNKTGQERLANHMQSLSQRALVTTNLIEDNHATTTTTLTDILNAMKSLQIEVKTVSQKQRASRHVNETQSHNAKPDLRPGKHQELLAEKQFRSLYSLAIQCEDGVSLVGPEALKGELIKLLDALIQHLQSLSVSHGPFCSECQKKRRTVTNEIQEARTIINLSHDFDVASPQSTYLPSNKDEYLPRWAFSV